MPTSQNDPSKQTDPFRDVAAFVNNAGEGGVAKPSLLEMASIMLPKGGGAMKGIDEKFSVNPVNGTASFALPLTLSPGRKGAAPELSLTYNSGGGNSPFGLGWQVGIPCIQRRTQKELPQYRDAEESDIFVFSGAEDLVPELEQDAQGKWTRKTATAGSVSISYYRPRIEGAFARIEKINDGGNVYWRVRTKDNIVSLFGQSDDAKLFSPVATEGTDKIFRWCLEYSYDDKGSVIAYTYKKENKDNILPALSEKNHLNDLAPFTNIYCKGIRYGNTTAWYEDGTADVSGTPTLPTDFFFELLFDYGEHDADKPTTTEVAKWPVRQDAFSDFRSGFEVRTYRLCRRLLLFHHFKAELGWDDYLVSSMELSYDEHPHLTYLSSITQTGYIWKTDGSLGSKQSLPPQEFSYFKPGFSREVKEVSTENIVNDPMGVDDTNYQWMDLYSEGISGILSEQAGGWFYKENLGNGSFSPAQVVGLRPSVSGLREGSLAIQDLEGDGRKYLVSTQAGMRGYYALSPGYGPGWGSGGGLGLMGNGQGSGTDAGGSPGWGAVGQSGLTGSDEDPDSGGIAADGGWQGFRAFEKYPNIDLRDPNLKFLDLNGDGMPDMLISQQQDFIWYAAKGKEGYDNYHLIARAADEEKGPQIVFADKDEKMLIATADMSGDGLADIVLITYAQVCYYPNLGYGQFGARVTLEMEGIFAAYTDFNPHHLHLADIDGSGTTDIVYTGDGTVQVWYNQSGNSLSAPSSFFNPFPELDAQSRLSLVDLLGTGVACLVWSSSLPAQSRAPLRYIDLMDGRKPHIMVGYKNNLGKETTLEYQSSTQYYLADKQAGRPWVTRLAFPVQCVSKVTVVDNVSQSRFTNEYSYHHGYYDAKEREFRGFARVEQRDCEEYDQFVKATQTSGAVNTTERDLYQPVVITKTWYHTGAWLHRKQIFHQLQQEYYPQALINSGQIDGTDLIAGLSDYFLDEQSMLPEGMEAAAISECYRALKGLPLRQEVYSEELGALAGSGVSGGTSTSGGLSGGGSLSGGTTSGSGPAGGSSLSGGTSAGSGLSGGTSAGSSQSGGALKKLFPYTVTQHDYDIQLLQPRADHKYAVFLPHEKETLSFNYERNPLDPRISHGINITIDTYGNVLESAAIVYGRKKADPDLPTDEDRQKQLRQYVLYTQNGFTTPIDIPATYRLPIACETQSWELNAPAPANNFFSSGEISQIYAGAATKLYEQAVQVNEKRKTGHARTLFLKDDLSGPMAFGAQDTLGLPYENYSMALTPTLGPAIYGGKFDDGFWRNKALYVKFQGDVNYWIRSGRVYFHPDLTATPDAQTIPPPSAADLDFARGNFYGPVAYEDNFGNLTKVFYDLYKLFIQRTVDALNNEGNVDAFQYRVLKPYLLRDANDNRTGVRFDELGRVIYTFVMGKEGEFKGDPIDATSTESSAGDQPTTMLEYEFRYYTSNGLLPDRVKSSVREQHYYTEPLPASTTGGLAGWLQKMFGGGAAVTAPASEASWQVSYTYSDGSGHEVLTKVQAEPGMAPQRDAQGKLLHDGTGNLIQEDTGPDLRWVGNGRTIYNNKGKPVKQYEPYFDSSYEYNQEDELAELGFTPLMYYDAAGRLVRMDQPNGSYSKTVFNAWMQQVYDDNDTVLDSDWYQARVGGAMGEAEQEAAQKAAIHAGTPSTTYFDSLGRAFLTVAANQLQRSNETVSAALYYSRKELDIQGNTLSSSDARGNMVMSWLYDMIGNICYQHSMDGGDRWMLADVTGKSLRLWDSRQQIFTYEYDAGHRPLNLLVNTGAGDTIFERMLYGEGTASDTQDNLRGKVYQHYDTAGLVTNAAYDFKGNRLASTRTLLKDYKSLPDWNASPVLESETFTNETAYDALNRPIQLMAADGSILLPRYNDANLLSGVDGKIRGASATTSFITGIDYNAKGQRQQILYGNNTKTVYTYDPLTYRLVRLLTTGGNGSTILQDLSYTYDPVGNITRQFDNAQKTVFYGGQQVEAQSDYIYDALYRMIEAGGREHSGQLVVSSSDNYNDSWCRLNLQPNSPVQLRNYTQKYFYDETGNIQKMQHTAAGTASWTRTYQYNVTNNQLTRTTVSGQSYNYTYNEHGSMLTMPQLTAMDWNFREQLQHAGLGGGGDVYYVYDSSGQRIRKVIVKPGNKTTDRIYLGMVEIYRERTGNTVTLERGTLHVMDSKRRVVMVDSRTKGNDGSPVQLIRYQYDNQLGSACLELDDTAKIISYEEYHPFGTTAYQATDASRQVPAKRYRYTGMERDDETGMNYHGARYYALWLGRWISTDPTGIGDGVNIYAYVNNNPLKMLDPTGTDGVQIICNNYPDIGMRYCFVYTDARPADRPLPSVQLFRLRLFSSDTPSPDSASPPPAAPAATAAPADAQPQQDGQPPTNVNTSATSGSGTNRQGSNEVEVTSQNTVGGNNRSGTVGSLGGTAAIRFSLSPPFSGDTAPYVYAGDLGITGGYSHATQDTSSSASFGLTARYGRASNFDNDHPDLRGSHGVSLSLVATAATDGSGAQSMSLTPTATYIYERALSEKWTLDVNGVLSGTFGGGSTPYTNINLLNTGTAGLQIGAGYDLGHRFTLSLEVLGYLTGGSGAPAVPGGALPPILSGRVGAGIGVSRKFGDANVPSVVFGLNVDGFYEGTDSFSAGGTERTQGGGAAINLGATFDVTRLIGH